ncbi:MAG: response regulator [Agarilytica sp.]
MPEEKFRILIVDDSPQEIHVLLEELKDDFAVTAATSGEDALASLAENEKPNLILLDVNMPGISGYETCEKIRADSDLVDIDIIFLSANDSTEEIIRGLDVGASDYITKPYDPDVLRSKIRQVVQTHTARSQLKEQADSASKLVYSLISESGNLGNIVNFLRTTFSIKTPESLLEATIESLRLYDLNAVVYFNAAPIRMIDSTSGSPTMLEIELLERLHGHHEPIVEKEKRAFIIKDGVVVLIKNMPLENEKRGSLKDQLMILLEGANAKLNHLAESAEKSSQQSVIIKDTIIQAKNSLDDIHMLQEAHKKNSIQILDDMVADVENAFFAMGLTDAQEKEIMDILAGAVNKSLDNFEHGLEVDAKIKKIVVDLSQLSTQAIQ